ncbi:unnamed protein product [Haemonchus placei]|uniref:C2H2-type domain-containing protein n=1 Tax=Haemonchus placei TaxID=6290 RepID=A0A0N4W129_HAEPC|nr:unnamed protein product [Haemonchus placei]
MLRRPREPKRTRKARKRGTLRGSPNVVVKSNLFSTRAPQTGCSEQTKEKFWSLLDGKTAEVPLQEAIVAAGDLNVHEGATKDCYSCHGGFGYGSRNNDGERILEHAESHYLAISRK